MEPDCIVAGATLRGARNRLTGPMQRPPAGVSRGLDSRDKPVQLCHRAATNELAWKRAQTDGTDIVQSQLANWLLWPGKT